MGRLLILFIAVPAIELALLIEIGSRIGTGATLGLILVTGALGAALARHQGLKVIQQVQSELATGALPASSLVDGLIIVIASALLVTPGVLTDVFGFLCLSPGFRGIIKDRLQRAFERGVESQQIHVEMRGAGFGPVSDREPMIDVTPPRDDPEERR
jgi:UPF0716 protein FxsA